MSTPVESGPAEPAAVPAGDVGTAPVTLRRPDAAKGRTEEAAAREGKSVNAWLVRAVSALDGARPGSHRSGRPGRRITGHARG